MPKLRRDWYLGSQWFSVCFLFAFQILARLLNLIFFYRHCENVFDDFPVLSMFHNYFFIINVRMEYCVYYIKFCECLLLIERAWRKFKTFFNLAFAIIEELFSQLSLNQSYSSVIFWLSDSGTALPSLLFAPPSYF